MSASLDPASLAPAEGLRQALLALATGLLHFRRNELRPTSVTLDKIYQSSWTALLRCIFIAWCERYGILPAEGNAEYARYHSLRSLVSQTRTGDLAPEAARSRLWGRLRRLWQVVGAGKKELGVPGYTGALFDEELQPLPTTWRIGDDAMGRFLNLLAMLFEIEELWSIPVLNRELASLLDQQLQYATVPTSVSKSVDGRLFRSQEGLPDDASGATTITLPAGTLYLQTGDVAALYPASTAEQVTGLVRGRILPLVHALFSRLSDPTELLANLRLQDPALDGGVTLLAAANLVAQELSMLESRGERSEQLKEQWLPSILANCCTGAALDMPAVELCRLMLRLAAGAPFVFPAEQAIRQGNSYLGARLADLRPYLKPRRRPRTSDLQLGLWQEAGADSETQPKRDAVHSRGSLSGWRGLADVWTAQHVGLDLGETDLRALARYFRQDSISVPGYDSVIRQAKSRAQVLHFFHPELSVWDHFARRDAAVPELLFLGDPQYLRRLAHVNEGRRVPARVRDLRDLESWQPGDRE